MELSFEYQDMRGVQSVALWVKHQPGTSWTNHLGDVCRKRVGDPNLPSPCPEFPGSWSTP